MSAEKAMRPILGRILVKPDTSDNVTPGGIHLPETVHDVSLIGIIIAMGPGPLIGDRIMPFSEIGLSVGDRVVFSYNAGIRTKYLGLEYRTVMYSDIQLVIESKEKIQGDLPYTPEYGVERV